MKTYANLYALLEKWKNIGSSEFQETVLLYLTDRYGKIGIGLIRDDNNHEIDVFPTFCKTSQELYDIYKLYLTTTLKKNIQSSFDKYIYHWVPWYSR